MEFKSAINSYKDLIVWQKSMELIAEVYKLTKQYPREELYILARETKRSAISIPSNIAEGSRRSTKKDYRQFLLMAYASDAELETQIEIAKRVLNDCVLDFTKIDSLLKEVMRMLNKLTHELEQY
ncbi:four helix bundle protein [Candidatus Falkowbacteria bacterium]|nr:four helix bundle protein [Candidatus Falkowbacteria bacterium]